MRGLQSNAHRSKLQVNAFQQRCHENTLAERVIQNTHPNLDPALVQNAHLFKSSSLEKTRVVHRINNSEAATDVGRAQIARV